MNKEKQRTSSWPTTEAEIKRIDSHWSGDTLVHDVYVDYSVEGKPYSNMPLGAYESGMYVEQIIPIKYNPNNPSKIVYGKESFNNSFIIVGGVMCGIGVIIPSCYFGYKLYKKKTAGKIGVVESTKFTKEKPQKEDRPIDKNGNIDYEEIKRRRTKAISEDNVEDK